MNTEFFRKAKPVWAVGKTGEKNITCLFSVSLKKGTYKLRVAACNFYRLTLDGTFLGYGPARAAHGYARVDEYTVTAERDGELCAEVVSYRCNSFYSLNEEPFFQAEAERDGKIVAYTDEDGAFACSLVNTRLQRVVRFSYQRPFSESYDFADNARLAKNVVPVQRVAGRSLLPRRVSYPLYDTVSAQKDETGEFFYEGEKTPYDNRYLTKEEIGIFPLAQTETNPATALEGIRYRLCARSGDRIGAGEYELYAFSCSETGFLQIDAEAETTCRFLIVFDEVDFRTEKKADEPREIRFERNDTYNIIEYRVPAGAFAHTAFEPYTVRYAKIIVLEGALRVKGLRMMRYENPDCFAFKAENADKNIALILDAAVRTFRHNAVDILTDCPSRERAGWLCDSWFSARAEKLFTGESRVEYNFLENIAFSPAQPFVPKGMIPMCYPADFSEEDMYIPNWSMWYLAELYDFSLRTGDKTLPEKSRGKVYDLLGYFERFENGDGLLEDLEGWIFVEWSKANDKEFVSGVNYPSNMMYAFALESAGKLYGDEALLAKAERIKRVVREQSFNGEFFEDNAVRENGRLVRTGHTSETCQYYAFFTGVASREQYPALWQTLLESFGPDRKEGCYPLVYPSNAFIGNYLRLILLKEYGYFEKVKEEAVDYFAKMARETGTLWEHDRIQGSLDHCFASYIAVLLSE